MNREIVYAVSFALLPTGVLADGDFGTREEAARLADTMIAIVDSDGLEMAIKAMHDPQQPFVSTRMGVNLFEAS